VEAQGSFLSRPNQHVLQVRPNDINKQAIYAGSDSVGVFLFLRHLP
jgi:hypothetical protein